MMLPIADSTDSIGWEAKAQEIPAQPWGSTMQSQKFQRKPWKYALPAPVFLPGEYHGWRGLVGYGLWGCRESDMTKPLTYTHMPYHHQSQALGSSLQALGCSQTWALVAMLGLSQSTEKND